MLTGSVYETDGDGIVRVTTREGKVGRFDPHGLWIDGELREADPHLCLRVGGRQLPAGQAASFKDLPLKTGKENGADA